MYSKHYREQTASDPRAIQGADALIYLTANRKPFPPSQILKVPEYLKANPKSQPPYKIPVGASLLAIAPDQFTQYTDQKHNPQ
jgi:hypothetical protein